MDLLAGKQQQEIFFIDVECLRERDGRLLIKELCIAQCDGSFQTWLFMPPHSFSRLPRQIRSENRWISMYLNGIEWTDGTVPLWKMKDIFNSYIPHGSIVFVKGLEKSQLLEWKLPERHIYNLEDLGCPPAGRIELALTKCMHPHHCIGDERNRCAQFKCARYMHWFHQEYLKRSSTSELHNVTSSLRNDEESSSESV
jgi:hypothetical protein